MSSASSKNSDKRPFPAWLADPFCCLTKSKGNPYNHDMCVVLANREEAIMSTTRFNRSEEQDGIWWRWGHLAARRDKDGISLTVNKTKNITIETPAMSSKHATVAADLLRAAAVDAGNSCMGKSVTELLWEELDRIVDRLMTGQEAEDGKDAGRAEGTAYALAVFQNPYRPNLDKIREEATDRWYEANPDEE